MRGREDQRGIDRFRLRNWRLRSKLAVVLLVPALTTATLAGLRLNTQLDDVELFGSVQRELAVSHQAAKVENALQVERDWAVQCVAAGRQNACPEHAARTGLTDVELSKYRDSGATATALSAPLQESFTKSLQSLAGLGSLRVTLLSTKYPDVAVISAYNQIIASLGTVHRAAVSSLSEPEIVPLVTAAQALYTAQEQLGQQNAILTSTALRKGFAPGAADELRAAQSRLDAAFNEFNDVASAGNQQKFQDVVSGSAVDGRNRLVRLALAQDAERKPVSITDAEVLKIGQDTANLVREVATELESQADATTTRLADVARGSAWRDAGLVAISLLIAFGLMAMVAQSMLRPLRVLRRSALDVARNQLPDAIRRIRSHRDPERAAEEAIVPVPLNTTEEVGQVARAFDLVQREAVRLAVEQVALRANVNDMFINLSRRSQALVERQISVIDRLEQDEQDPDHLASLFELDHLATQMRRNSENLLVLSGTTVNRRVTRPVAIAEVLGAAVSEVEKYARVQIAPTPELMVQGRVVNDLAHLVAELLDNATAFSKPTTKVTVRTIETRKGEVAIRIHDRGVGMQESDVVEFNAKLAEPPEVDVSVAREMGLYVVGQLAKRHEIRVTLGNNDDIEGGVTAQVILPISLLHKGSAPALPLPAAPLPAIESTSTGEGLSGVPKWTPEHPVVVPGPATEDENSGRHRIEQTSADGLFTARIEADEEAAEAGYSYEPPVERPAEPATEIFPAIVDEPLISHDDLSRWFQTPSAPEPSTKVLPPAEPEPAELDLAGHDLAGHDDAEPATVNGLPKRQRSADTVKIEAPSAVPRAVADYADSDWGAADEGWKAAGALGNGGTAQTTENGLPKRVPKARLVPGSLPKPSSPAPQLTSASAIPGRSADRLRQRFATYQKGVQMGRESLFDSAVGGIPVIAERERQ
ncbi:nitrate- and nitrite sensing domain-containing protein [Lentzea sp. BCCO 10_0061]|uniref:histidine kinase n=1 Tax=Lentzea sokolovensis TaxID=3095429 RepID=A0ABU4V6P2_9PSEU|nr:nitrate- and nitrite sensing domain-containing protein [Lentzea sp. BCCO 10_0061]MDX8146641.1 nitrate- and nitrite sensing domain-containing protein [Lentzea sp. BCCO 10_0061]